MMNYSTFLAFILICFPWNSVFATSADLDEDHFIKKYEAVVQSTDQLDSVYFLNRGENKNMRSYIYDDEGVLIESVWHFWSTNEFLWKVSNKSIYIYDEQGRLYDIETYPYEMAAGEYKWGDISHKSIIRYNHNADTIEIADYSYNYNGVMSGYGNRYVWAYDGENLIKEEVYSWSSSTADWAGNGVSNTWRYDDRGNIITKLIQNWDYDLDEWKNWTNEVWLYDENDTLIQSEISQWEYDEKRWQMYRQKIWDYDANYNVQDYIDYEYNWKRGDFDSYEEFRYKRAYDKSNNLLSSEKYTWDTSTQEWAIKEKWLGEYNTSNDIIHETLSFKTINGWATSEENDRSYTYDYGEDGKVAHYMMSYYKDLFNKYMTKEEHYFSYNIFGDTIADYDVLEESARVWTYDESRNLILAERRAIDADNNWPNLEFSSSINRISSCVQYTYDDDNRLTQRLERSMYIDTISSYVFKNGDEKEVYAYDDNGNLTFTEMCYWDEWDQIWEGFKYGNLRNDYLYDKNNNMIEKVSYNWNSDSVRWIYDDKYILDYDDHGNLLQNTSFVWYNSSSWKGTSHEMWAYNEFGNMLSYIDYNWDYNLEIWVPNYYGEFWTYTEHEDIESYRVVYWDDDINAFKDVSNRSETYFYSAGNVVGVRENALSVVSIYPNPANDVFTIDISNDNREDVSVKIFSLSGQLLYHQTNLNHQKSQVVHQLQSGNYLIHVQKGNSTYISQLLIQ